MKRLLPGIAFALAAAIGCADGGMEIPTVELGGSAGARLMNGQARTPVEAYEKAYAGLSRAHYNVRRNLEPRGQNEFAAREAMGSIVRCLEVMRACVPGSGQPKFDPYILRYRDWQKALENGTWGGSFLTDFERSERDVKTTFSPAATDLLVEFPAAPGTKPAAPKPPADTGLTPDKVELPVVQPPPAAEPAPTTPKPSPPAPVRPAPPAAPALSARLLYKAWSAAHDDLIAAYREKKPCKVKYDDVVESLRLLKEQLGGDKASKLQIYIDYYGDINDKTKSFTALPEKTTEKDVVDELEVAARVIRKEFNPDK